MTFNLERATPLRRFAHELRVGICTSVRMATFKSLARISSVPLASRERAPKEEGQSHSRRVGARTKCDAKLLLEDEGESRVGQSHALGVEIRVR